MNKTKKYKEALIAFMFFPSIALGQVVERFPKPDFQSGYTRPILQTPAPPFPDS